MNQTVHLEEKVRALAISLCSVFLLSIGADVFAGCEDKGPIPCTVNGKKGFRECQANGHMGKCIVEPADPDPAVSGKIYPKFYILTVVYAPPGTKGGGSASKVQYKEGSSTGTTVSSNSSFKNGVKVTASAKAAGVTVGADFSADNTESASSKMAVEKKEGSGIDSAAPKTDGIDHTQDLIYFLVKPELAVTVDGTKLDWSFTGNSRMRWVRAGQLEKPETMEPNLKKELEGTYGFTAADYKQMLKSYPFASGKTAIDPNRFAYTGMNLPYQPPASADEVLPTWNMVLDNTTTTTTGKAFQTSTAVGLSVGAEGGFPGVFEAKLQTSASWTWTCTNEKSESDGKSQTAAFTLGSPSFGYEGPIGVDVYYDTLYKTFMFAFPPEGSALRTSGVVRYETQGPIAGREVYLRVGGKTYRTFTNQRGEYRFYGAPLTGMEVQVDGIGKRKVQRTKPVANFIVADKLTTPKGPKLKSETLFQRHRAIP
jgi:hypothetical protein